MGVTGDQLDVALTEQDVDLLNAHGHDDDTLVLLATTHAARAQALFRAATPERAAKLFLLVADRFLTDAKTAQAADLARA